MLLGLHEARSQEYENFSKFIKTSDSLVYGGPDEAIRQAEMAIAIAENLKNDSLLAEAMYRRGSGYWSKGDLSEALEALLIAQQLISLNNIPLLEANIQKRIGTLYYDIQDYFTAIAYYKKAVKCFVKSEHQHGLIGSNSNIGRSFRELGQYDSAIFYLRKSLSFIEADDLESVRYVSFNLGEIYFSMGRYEQALPYISKCKEISLKLNRNTGIIRSNRLLAEIMLTKGDFSTADVLSRRSLESANLTNSKILLSIATQTRSKVLFSMGDFKEAYLYKELAYQYQDSVRSKKNQTILKFFDTKKTKDQISALRKEKDINELKAKNSRIIVVAAFIVALLAITLAYVFYQSRKLENAKNKELRKQNSKIESQRVSLEELIEFKSRVIAIASHDLKSPIQGLVGILDLIEKRAVTMVELNRFLPEIRLKIKNNYQKIVDLMHWTSRDIVENQPFDVRDCIEEVAKELSFEMSSKNIKSQFQIETLEETVGDKNLLKTVLRNLISNAIKFSKQEGLIVVRAHMQRENIIITVIDSGIGMNQSMIESLFKKKSHSTTGSGLGLIICKDLIETINGEIKVESELEKGSKFFVTVPVTRNVSNYGT